MCDKFAFGSAIVLGQVRWLDVPIAVWSRKTCGSRIAFGFGLLDLGLFCSMFALAWLAQANVRARIAARVNMLAVRCSIRMTSFARAECLLTQVRARSPQNVNNCSVFVAECSVAAMPGRASC